MEADRDKGQERTSSVFVSNGKKHISHPIWKLVSVLVALPIGSIFVGGFLSYRAFFSEVGGVVRSEIKDVQYNKDYTLFEKVDEIDDNQKDLKKDLKKCQSGVNFVLCFINKNKNCQWDEHE